MDIEQRRSNDPILGEAEQDLMTLVDLQRFLADELSDSVDISTDFSKSFTPLTQGLGIHSVRTAPMETLQRFPADLPKVLQEVSPVSELRSQSAVIDHLLEVRQEQRPSVPERRESPRPAADNRRQVTRFVDESVMEEEFEKETTGRPATSFRVKEGGRLQQALAQQSQTDDLPELDAVIRPSAPPPLPRVGMVRRAMASLMDQVFVWTLGILGLVFVLNVLSTGSASSSQLLKEFLRPEVMKYLAVGFGGVWLCYLVVSVGILESTFGMWIWGIRINYGQEQRFVKKFARIGLSFLFQAPLVPSLLLVFQREGKNLIDSLSGTQVFRSAS